MISNIGIVILWAIIAIIITIIVFYFLIYWELTNLPNTIVTALSNRFSKPCELDFPLEYREAVYIPETNGVYEKKLATALLDTCFMTSSANCATILPIPNPPGFTDQLRIEGVVNGENILLAYIFWNESTGQAIIASSGTESLAAWRADFTISQVPPTGINGYQEGMLMHKGFYNVYMAMRNRLWDWYSFNPWVTTLFTTGHSLGASLASICAFDFSNGSTNITNIINYTYGSPRIANVVFAQQFDQQISTSINVINTEDVVPSLVLAQFFDYTYETLGQLVPFIDSGGSLSYNHINSYYYNLPDEPECAK